MNNGVRLIKKAVTTTLDVAAMMIIAFTVYFQVADLKYIVLAIVSSIWLITRILLLDEEEQK